MSKGRVQGPQEVVQGPLIEALAPNHIDHQEYIGKREKIRPLHILLWPLHLIETEPSIIWC